jgi:hypothetical protein
MTTKFKVKRITAGCYLATYGDEQSYIEKASDGSWQSDCCESDFETYGEARAHAETVLTENAAY